MISGQEHLAEHRNVLALHDLDTGVGLHPRPAHEVRLDNNARRKCRTRGGKRQFLDLNPGAITRQRANGELQEDEPEHGPLAEPGCAGFLERGRSDSSCHATPRGRPNADRCVVSIGVANVTPLRAANNSGCYL